MPPPVGPNREALLEQERRFQDGKQLLERRTGKNFGDFINLVGTFLSLQRLDASQARLLAIKERTARYLEENLPANAKARLRIPVELDPVNKLPYPLPGLTIEDASGASPSVHPGDKPYMQEEVSGKNWSAAYTEAVARSLASDEVRSLGVLGVIVRMGEISLDMMGTHPADPKVLDKARGLYDELLKLPPPAASGGDSGAQPMPVTPSDSEKAFRVISRARDDYQVAQNEPASGGAPAPGPTEPPLPPLVPTVPEPVEPGEVQASSVPGRPAPKGISPQLWQQLWRVRAQGMVMRRQLHWALAQAHPGSDRPMGGGAPPPPQGGAAPRGPVEVPFSIDAGLLIKQDKQPVASLGMGAAFGAVLKASPALKAFFEMALLDGLTERRAWELSQLYGHYLVGTEPLQLGDVFRAVNPMAGPQPFWGVVISADGNQPAQSLLYAGGLHLRSGPVGTIQVVWRPVPAKLFADASPLGRYWGPAMLRMRRVVSELCVGQSRFVALLAEGTPLAGVTHAAELASRLGPQVRPLQPNLAPPPGSVLFAADGCCGVRISNGGVVVWDATEPVSLEQFRPTAVWMPSL